MIEKIFEHQKSIDDRERASQFTSAMLLTWFITVSTLSILEYRESGSQNSWFIHPSSLSELESTDLVRGATHLVWWSLSNSKLPWLKMNIPLECLKGDFSQSEKAKCIVWRDFCMVRNPTEYSVKFCSEVFLWNIWF